MTRRAAESVLLLSPHLDDAAFSCGGLMLKLVGAAANVTVATVFAGSPGAGPTSPLGTQLTRRFEPKAWVAERRREDMRALTAIGAVVRHGRFVDAAFRRDADGAPMYGSWPSVFAGTWRTPDDALIDRITAQIAAWCLEAGADRIYVPLGCGGHVDHLLLHEAAIRGRGRFGARLCFYEELPYSAGAGLPTFINGIGPVTRVLIDVRAKMTLIGQYRLGLGTAAEPEITPRTIEQHAYSRLDAHGIPAEWHWDAV
jgi:LmbE family N-acetylglucosaminyl deacetylase